MVYNSVKVIESKACEGVKFVIKRMVKRRMFALDEALAPGREKIRALNEEFQPLDKERKLLLEAADALVKPERDKLVAAGATPEEAERQVPRGKIDFPDDKLQRWVELLNRIRAIDSQELGPAMMRFCLVRIENLEITYPDSNGQEVTCAATLDLLIEHGPDELYDEIFAAISSECGLLPAEVENLSSPSTSAAAVDGKPASAESAAKPETTSILAA